MEKDEKIIPWVDEIQNYLTDSSVKVGRIKNVLKNVDFSNLDEATKTRLSKMFDPTKKVSEKLFKRELDLYFALLDNKPRSISLPIFSEYVDSVFSQAPSKLSDEYFDAMVTRSLKANDKNLSPAIKSFVLKLPEEYDKNIDDISKKRLSTLVNVLLSTNLDYEKLPKQCQEFVKSMFMSCAVRTEISDKNQKKFNNLFRSDPQKYYTMQNRAFAGVSQYESWVDEPANKLRFMHLINYANFQSQILSKSLYNLGITDLRKRASEIGLEKLPPYEKQADGFDETYMQTPRDYRAYAKKLSGLFAGFVKHEVGEVEKQSLGEKFPTDRLYELAVTSDMQKQAGKLRTEEVTAETLQNYANYLIGIVHLDELTGKKPKEIYNASERVQTRKSTGLNKLDRDLAGIDTGVLERIRKGRCEVEDLPELYEVYNILLKHGKRDLDLENMIVDLQVRADECAEQEKE